MLENGSRVAMSRKLHIGGEEPAPDWEILNILPGPNVDHVGDAIDLSRFADDTFIEIYASHILEHIPYKQKLEKAIGEWYRVLAPGGQLYVSVPDLRTLAQLFLSEDLSIQQRHRVMRMMFGGQMNEYDFHYAGIYHEFLVAHLSNAGFVNLRRVPEFEFFDDDSRLRMHGVLISLNMIAQKPG